MRPSTRILPVVGGCLLLLLAVAGPRMRAADPSPSPSPSPAASPKATPAPTPTKDPEIVALSARLVAAPDDAARDAILAAAPPEVAHGIVLRRRFRFDYGKLINSGDYDRAQVLAQYARRLALQNNDPLGAAKEDQNLGNIEGYRGNNRAALALFEKCKQAYTEAGAHEALAGINSCIGIIHQQFGDYRQALDDARQALAGFQAVGYKEGTINAYNALGTIYDDQGLHERAMDNFQQALAIAGDDESWAVYLLANMANVWETRGDFVQAAALVERSLALAEKLDDKPRQATDLQTLARYHARGEHPDLARAEDENRRALAIAEKAADKRRQTSVLTDLGDLQRRQGRDLPGALALAQHAVALAHDTGEPAYIWRADTLAGKLHRALGQPDAARAEFGEAIAAVEDARGHLAVSDESAANFLDDDKIDPYRQMVALLVGENHPAEALAMAERAKARTLVEILRSPKLDPATQMTPAEHATADRLAKAVANANRDLLAARAAQQAPAPDKMAALTAALERARHDRDAADQDFFVAHPEFRNRQPPREDPLTPAVLNALAGDGHASLLEYVVTDEQTLLFVVTPGGHPSVPADVRAFTLPLGRDALARRTQDFRRTLADRGMGWQTAARELGDVLLTPTRTACANAQRLVVVPDGPLWELPFQALAADGKANETAAPLRTLWEAFPVSYAPSLTFLAQEQALAGNRQMSHAPTLLACGDPALGKNPAAAPAAGSVLMGDEFVPLPDAARQVRELGKLYGADHSRTLIGADADENAFKKLAGDYDVIHFATHGLLNDQSPMYSRLLMSQTNLTPDEDGLLEAWEWLPLHLHARLAVLSACETGRGRIGEGEGVLGQSWALFAAGCPASVVSQWKVDSAGTTELMLGFHRRLLAGDEPSEALREAALELAKKPGYGHPFYWAPFVLVGAGERIAPSLKGGKASPAGP